MKYPNIIFFRYDKYANIDTFFETNKDNLLCNVNITSDSNYLNNIFDSNFHLLVTFGDNFSEYCNDVNNIIPSRMYTRWIHVTEVNNVDSFNSKVNFCYINNVTHPTQITFSVFTTCYNSYDKILRAYDSMKLQTMKDWEWVIMDDSPEDKHFDFLRNLFKNDKRIRLYKRSENSGNIGNVKNEVVSLCRGKYLLELDHDDTILEDVLLDSTNVFDKDDTVGFIYMDYSNIYENGANYWYGNSFSLGYAGYYMQYYNGRWIYVASTPNINNVTLSHIVAVPNHPRIWRRSVLMQIGNYNEYLPISDDYELLLRTAVRTKIVKIHKLGYIQYMNDNNNNFSLIRNSEINRLCNDHLQPQCYTDYKIDMVMKEKGAYEENCGMIWKRSNYEPKYCNDIINANYKKQYCIVGVNKLISNLNMIEELYKDTTNDFIVLDNTTSHNEISSILNKFNFFRMKCYSMNDCSESELINYFHLVYKSCPDYIIL